MSRRQLQIKLNIRRYDLSEEPEVEEKTVELYKYMEYNNLKKELMNICHISPNENKVIKLRNKDGLLIPLSFLLEEDHNNNPVFVDVSNVTYTSKNKTSMLQDAYVDAVRQKMQNMESRIAQAELLLPQLEWRRQAHMEETVSRLSSKVAFLNRRFDELLPQQWRAKMPHTMA